VSCAAVDRSASRHSAKYPITAIAVATGFAVRSGSAGCQRLECRRQLAERMNSNRFDSSCATGAADRTC
jgi:hypothetical protein